MAASQRCLVRWRLERCGQGYLATGELLDELLDFALRGPEQLLLHQVPPYATMVIQVIRDVVALDLNAPAKRGEELSQEGELPDFLRVLPGVEHVDGGRIVLLEDPPNEIVLKENPARRVVWSTG